MPAKKKASLSLVETAERGSLLERLCLPADSSVARQGFNPFPVSHSFVLCFFALLHKLQLRVKPLTEEYL